MRAADTIGSDATGNVVARFGGDEFLLLINDLNVHSDAKVVAQRLLDALAPAYNIFGSELRSTASVGIVTSDQSQVSAEDILRNADVAMYEAKRAGRACSVIFNEAMHTRLARHVAIEADLHKAIGTDELSLVFQPIVELDSGRMVSAEALLRWNHPQLGQIPPSEFIPIAEDSGLIVTLGQWVLTEACKAFVRWRQLDPQRAPQTVSVNISRAELALGSQLLERVLGTLESIGMSPQCLQLEVTEREVMRNPETSLAVMRELRRLGIHLAMDDFGTGTSSLRFLQEYPFDTIKIDRSFVKDLNTGSDVLAVIHATVGLIENLGMASLAEGIEEPAQLAILQSLGCRFAQGYLFSRPVTAERLLDALQPRADNYVDAMAS
jgi:predicted signal transduction protein with EAL and GGDEF domain